MTELEKLREKRSMDKRALEEKAPKHVVILALRFAKSHAELYANAKLDRFAEELRRELLLEYGRSAYRPNWINAVVDDQLKKAKELLND